MASDVSSAGAGAAAWALATLLILIIVISLLYFGGAFKSKKAIDININKPGVVLVLPIK
jgi:hypothetical protein